MNIFIVRIFIGHSTIFLEILHAAERKIATGLQSRGKYGYSHGNGKKCPDPVFRFWTRHKRTQKRKFF